MTKRYSPMTGYRTDRVKQKEKLKMKKLQSQGLSLCEIAERCGRSERTVRKQLASNKIIVYETSVRAAVMEKQLIKHFDDLCALIERLGNVVELLTASNYYEDKEPIDWVRPVEHYEDQIHQDDKDNAYIFKKTSGGLIVSIVIQIERHPLFESLKNHLDSEVLHLYEEWRTLLEQIYKYEGKTITDWATELANENYAKHEQMKNVLVQSFDIARYKRVFEGTCKMCPE